MLKKRRQKTRVVTGGRLGAMCVRFGPEAVLPSPCPPPPHRRRSVLVHVACGRGFTNLLRALLSPATIAAIIAPIPRTRSAVPASPRRRARRKTHRCFLGSRSNSIQQVFRNVRRYTDRHRRRVVGDVWARARVYILFLHPGRRNRTHTHTFRFTGPLLCLSVRLWGFFFSVYDYEERERDGNKIPCVCAVCVHARSPVQWSSKRTTI